MAASISALDSSSERAIGQSSPHFSVSNLAKTYGDLKVLSGIDLTAPRGQFLAIVGKSGCGKSTLLRLIAGLEKPSSGEIAFYSDDPGKFEENIRIMFQDARLLPWKRVLANVGLGQQGDWKVHASTSLKEVGLLDRANDWPSVLSGGQRQRVALARALVSQPKLLLLDEPFGALDALTRIEMQRLIEKLWREHGFTVLLITHDVEEAVALADRVILVDQGQVSLDLSVKLDRPRQRNSPAFGELTQRLLDQIIGPDVAY